MANFNFQGKIIRQFLDKLIRQSTSNASGIKPSMNLKSNVIITGGEGTLQNPFTLALE